MNPALRGSIAVLLLRLLVGIAMPLHGWSKIQDPFHWMDKAANHPPGFLQALAAVAEFAGGLGVLVGLLTPVACAGIVATMAVAIYTHISRGDPFIGKGVPSYELASVYLTIAASLILTGPGRYSLDQLLIGQKKRSDY